MIYNKFYVTYPFTIEAIENLSKLEIDIYSLPTKYADIFALAIENVDSIIDSGEFLNKKIFPNDELLLYPITKMLIELINNDFLRNKFAEVFSKRIGKFLIGEDLSTIRRIAMNTLKWDVEIGDFVSSSIDANRYNCKLKFNYYLSTAPHLRDSSWKLINRELDSGYVLLNKGDLVRLISERVKLNIIEKKVGDLPTIPDEIKEKVDYFNEKIKKIKANVGYKLTDSIIISQEVYPPCMNMILSRLNKGENLDHSSRLVLLFFLITTGKKVDEIIDLFRVQPDFNEKKTRYYIEHAYGDKGSKTKYSSYGCAKINTFGLCIKDNWCNSKNFKNPIQYLQRKNWQIKNVIIPRILTFPFSIISKKQNSRNISISNI